MSEEPEISAADSVEHTLAIIKTAHVYKLPPRPSGGAWICQNWPKDNHIFTGRVRVVALGEVCTVRLEDPAKDNALFAQCPLDNERPELSVEPVSDSSRYFVVRVSDGSGRHAFLGMGFVERSDAFEFNVTLQDHVKRLRAEREAEQAYREAEQAPPTPPQDFSLKGSVSIALPTKARAGGGGGEAKRERPAQPGAIGGLGSLLPPPPGVGAAASQSRGRPRPVAAAPVATAATAASSADDPFAAVPNPFRPAAGNPFAPSADDPFAGQPNPFGEADATFGAAFSGESPGADAGATSPAQDADGLSGGVGALSVGEGGVTNETAASAPGGWVAFGS